MDKQKLLKEIQECVELGKVNKMAPFPPKLKGKDGADELTKQAIEQGIEPSDILNEALVKAMDQVGRSFSEKKVFVPQLLVSAKAMSAALTHLKPFFTSGAVKRKGKFIIGTVAGDLHDIGKNLVAMIVEGAGYEVIDLGVDVNSQKFLETIRENEDAKVGLSALLTTTMVNMRSIVKEIKAEFPDTKLIIGGAPVDEEFKNEIGADGYASEPQGAVDFLNSLES